jgi:phage shock protein A
MLLFLITLSFAGIEDMKRKRSELQNIIDEQEDVKMTLQREAEKMSLRLAQINTSLSQMIAARNEYDQTITETETAYAKVNVYKKVKVKLSLCISS